MSGQRTDLSSPETGLGITLMGMSLTGQSLVQPVYKMTTFCTSRGAEPSCGSVHAAETPVGESPDVPQKCNLGGVVYLVLDGGHPRIEIFRHHIQRINTESNAILRVNCERLVEIDAKMRGL
jgi:hypothetical protein